MTTDTPHPHEFLIAQLQAVARFLRRHGEGDHAAVVNRATDALRAERQAPTLPTREALAVTDADVVDALTAFYDEEREGWSMAKVRSMRAALEAALLSHEARDTEPREVAAEARDTDRPPSVICRECAETKHGACDGTAMVERGDTDIVRVPCICSTHGHR